MPTPDPLSVLSAADPSAVVPSPVIWDAKGAPRSRSHGDVYFSRDDGLGESRAVFLKGCGLPEAWAGRRGFTVGELGFGTGLNIAALLDLWDGARPSGGHLNIFTVEASPLSAEEAARALGAWPEIAPIAAAMIAQWPGRARGFHRMDLPALATTIDVAILEAGEALEAWGGAADAWFLDGFSPALNPDIWRSEVIDLIARRSAPGARAATYTVAGAVRRDLVAAGFTVERAPGHGRKRQRLEARLPGGANDPPPPRVAIVGAGIAGAALARAFRVHGVEARVFDASGPGSGASGAPAGLMAPRLDAGLGPAAALFAQAARRAARLYEEVPGAVLSREALQLAQTAKDPRRFEAIARSDLFETGAMRREGGAETTGILGEAAPEGLTMQGAVVVAPRAVLAAWLGETMRARVAALDSIGSVWRLRGEDGAVLAEADVVCLAGAMDGAALAPGLGLTPVRGQASFADGFVWDRATVFGAYLIPMPGGVLFGATHDRDDADPASRPEDRRRNLAAVAAVLPVLAGRLGAAALSDWSAVRATTVDYLPLAGGLPGPAAGRLVLSGLGSRGLCLAPLLAEHLAALALGRPSPLPRPLADLVDPARFAARAARKGRPPGQG